MSNAKFYWRQAAEIQARNYVCGHCGNSLSSNDGYTKASNSDGSGATVAFIYICHHCLKPTHFEEGKHIPGARYGEDVKGVSDSGVESLYKEARDSYSQSAFTASVLCCRKLLMHIAISKGAATGLKFIEYVEFLSSENYVPRDAKGWVDQIRLIGNEANHEIVIMTEEQAKDLLSFVAMLLKLVYEFPSKVPTSKAVTTP